MIIYMSDPEQRRIWMFEESRSGSSLSPGVQLLVLDGEPTTESRASDALGESG